MRSVWQRYDALALTLNCQARPARMLMTTASARQPQLYSYSPFVHHRPLAFFIAPDTSPSFRPFTDLLVTSQLKHCLHVPSRSSPSHACKSHMAQRRRAHVAQQDDAACMNTEQDDAACTHTGQAERLCHATSPSPSHPSHSACTLMNTR